MGLEQEVNGKGCGLWRERTYSEMGQWQDCMTAFNSGLTGFKPARVGRALKMVGTEIHANPLFQFPGT
ncbi:hypothetical protein M0804_007929 [Polistes exclamans]|nr:hypothetical protein M0804_007929 [Polistes exclamans]